MNQPDGGPAFPVTQIIRTRNHPEGDAITFPGMSLRDYFAAMALQGYVTGMVATGGRPALKADVVAEDCTVLADAMLKQREAP